MSKEKAQSFFEKKKEERMAKMKDSNGDGQKDAKDTDTSKMPEGLRKHFEKKRSNK